MVLLGINVVSCKSVGLVLRTSQLRDPDRRRREPESYHILLPVVILLLPWGLRDPRTCLLPLKLICPVVSVAGAKRDLAPAFAFSVSSPQQPLRFT